MNDELLSWPVSRLAEVVVGNTFVIFGVAPGIRGINWLLTS
jgi:hypothetical protein